MIDGYKKLKNEQFQEFLQSAGEQIAIMTLDDKICTLIKTEDLRSFFLNFKSLHNDVSDDDEIFIHSETSDCTLRLAGIDFKWWSENTRRMNRLFKRVEKCEPKKDDFLITIYSALKKKDESIIEESSETFSNKKEAIQYINKKYRVLSIRSFFEDSPVFKFNENENWKTIEELNAEGVLEI